MEKKIEFVGPYTVENLLCMGINESVLAKSIKANFLDFRDKKFEISEVDTLDKMALFTDLYIGTILNKMFSKEEVLEILFEVELPKNFEPYCIDFNKYQPILKWGNHYISGIATRYNHLLLSVVDDYVLSEDEFLFKITT